jgi:hypothetical protein
MVPVAKGILERIWSGVAADQRAVRASATNQSSREWAANESEDALLDGGDGGEENVEEGPVQEDAENQENGRDRHAHLRHRTRVRSSRSYPSHSLRYCSSQVIA